MTFNRNINGSTNSFSHECLDDLIIIAEGVGDAEITSTSHSDHVELQSSE